METPRARQPITVQLIGSLQIRRGDVQLTAHDLGAPKPRQILEILLLHRGTPVSKVQLVELVWGHEAPADVINTLQSYVSVLRRQLQPGEPRTGPLQTANGGYVIDRDLVETDLDLFDALVRSAEQAERADAYRLLCQALALAGEPLLGDELNCEWAETERSLHAARVTAVRLQAAETAIGLGRPDDAVSWARAVLATDQLNERAWSLLILAMEQAGQYAEGLQAYEQCRRALHRELGCSPGPVLRAAYARLLSATADADGELSEALSALLYLHEQLTRRDQQQGDARPAGASVRAAGRVLNEFVRKALAVA